MALDPEHVLDAVARWTGVTPEDMTRRFAGWVPQDVARARRIFYLALHRAGVNGAEIGRHLGVSKQAVSRGLARVGAEDRMDWSAIRKGMEP